jgi:hypothetical protein
MVIPIDIWAAQEATAKKTRAGNFVIIRTFLATVLHETGQNNALI